MTSVSLHFNPADFPAMREAFREKYGDETGKTGTGGLSWRGEKANVMLNAFFADIEMGKAQRLMMMEQRKKELEPERQKARQGAKDL